MSPRRRKNNNFALYFFVSFSIVLLCAVLLKRIELNDLQNKAIEYGYAEIVNDRFEWKQPIF